MNWYRFKIELSAWLAKTALLTFSVLVMGRVLFQPEGGHREYHLALRVVAENEWMFPVVLTVGLAVLWLCYWKVFQICRSRRAYGEN